VDPVTHTLVGIGMANAFFRRRLGREAVPALAIASNLPDLDAIVHLSFDPRALLLRRTFGHSILLLPFWSAGLALVLRRYAPHIGFRRLLGLSLLGAGAHLVFDLINSFGVVLLWPLSDWRPELAIVFIIDLLLTGLLLAPLLLCAVPRFRGRLSGLSRASLAAVVVYLLVCAGNRALAQEALAAVAGGSRADLVYVFPEPLGPQRWRGVVGRGDTYGLYLIHAPSGRVDPAGSVRTLAFDPRVEAVRRTPLGRRLGAFFKAPVWSVRDGRGGPAQVTVYDLRFVTLVLPRKPIFGYSFRVDGSGRVKYEP
jgi:membrane-bound metal-dependent hydrolase YbcI (DUF457 family)